jgi:hypothetical protein
VAEIDPFDDTKVRYVIRRHQFDPNTNHFRWFFEKAYDNKREYEKKLSEAFEELEVRRLVSDVDSKEQLTGIRLEIGHFSSSASRRANRIEQGAFHPVTWKTKISFFYHSNRFRLLQKRRRF